jgi:hypothetical protein
MIKLLKWDLVDALHRTPLIWAGVIFSLLALLIPQNGNGLINAILIVVGPVVGFITFQAIMILAAYLPVGWLHRESYLLEASTPWPAWLKLLAKVIWAVVLDILGFVFMLQLFDLIGRFSGGSLRLVSLDQLKGIPALVLIALVLDCTIMFSYILAGSFSFTRRNRLLAGGFISLVIFVIIIAVIMIWMMAAGSVILPSVSMRDIITLDGSFQVLSNTIPVVVCLISIIVEFLAGSGLLANRFQRE